MKGFQSMMKRSGFTLAEVLITLGIIGVVAAMTIPNLIANTNGAKFRSQFKKTISTLNQAGLMSQAQYDFDYAGTSTCTIATGATEHPEEEMTFCSILNGTLTGQTYIGAASNLKRNANGSSTDYKWVSGTTSTDVTKLANGLTLDNSIIYTLADGSIVGFNAAAEACELPIGTQLTDAVITGGAGGAGGAGAVSLAKCTGFIDVNGVTLPNKEVNCGTTPTAKVQTPCTVKNSANQMTDVFPIVFHDATVEPASDAAKYVLTSSK